MFIDVDYPTSDLKIQTLKQIIPKAGSQLHLLIDKDQQDDLRREWKEWFREKDSTEPVAMELYDDLLQQINPVSASVVDSINAEKISSLCLKSDVEFLNHLLKMDPIKLSDLRQVENTMGGLVHRGMNVNIFDRYLLKHPAERLQQMDDTTYDLFSLQNLIILLKGMKDDPPRQLHIFSEFFQPNEYNRIKDAGTPEFKEIVMENTYESFVRGLMESLINEIRSVYPNLRKTVIKLVDCSRRKYTRSALPHDRYLTLNQITMVSTAGFNFSGIRGWKEDDYRTYSSETRDNQVAPTMLIPIRDFGKPPAGNGLVEIELGIA